MTLKSDIERTKKVASDLIQVYYSSEFFKELEMPDYSPPNGVSAGSTEHIVFLTLTLSTDPLGNTPEIWKVSRKAFDDDKTKYLYSPEALCEKSTEQILRDLINSGFGKRKRKDAENWKKIGVSIYRRWGGDPRNFILSHNGDTRKILDSMRTDKYSDRNDFPEIIGENLGPLWISLLKDHAECDLFCSLNNIPIKADINITRASVALGLISGKYSGQLKVISQRVSDLWKDALKESEIVEKKITSINISGPLRLLSKNGCLKKDGKRIICPEFQECPLNTYCVKGLFSIGPDGVIIDTCIET